jgi:hypothetical protein
VEFIQGHLYDWCEKCRVELVQELFEKLSVGQTPHNACYDVKKFDYICSVHLKWLRSVKCTDALL